MLLFSNARCRSVSFAVLLGLFAASAAEIGEVAEAADGPSLPRGHTMLLPFPRSERAQSVWQSGLCWSACGAQCAWGQNTCLQVNSQANLQVNEQGPCLAYANSCDRYCQRECRTSGGPLIDFTD